MDKDVQHEIRNIIEEIEKKSVDVEYIYRGESKDYGKISSSLWRECRKEIGLPAFEVGFIQDEIVKVARNYDPDLKEDDFEIMSTLQHYDGHTNLIDFTTDCHIALFFACDGHYDKNGRVILLQQTDRNKEYFKIKIARYPKKRVIAQKSVFVQPPKGFIEPHKDDIVTIPANLKQSILQYLHKDHCISTETIYNDLHGFIKHQSKHQRAYIAFYLGLSHSSLCAYDSAIVKFSEAIELNPNFAEAYINRGNVHSCQDKYACAITDFSNAIELNPNLIQAYSNRGRAHLLSNEVDLAMADLDKVIDYYAGDAGDPAVRYNGGETSIPYDVWLSDAKDPSVHYDRGMALLHRGEWKKARQDLKYARNIGMINLVVSFQEDYGSIAEFQNRIGGNLPQNIADILTNTQS